MLLVIQMNETIGEKGGANDLRREMRISHQQKKKLKEYEEEREIAELEKEVKKKQIYTFIKTLPIVIGGGTIQVLHDTATGKKRDLEEENSRWRIKEYDQDVTHMTPEEFEDQRRRKIIVTPTGEKIVVYVSAPVDEKAPIQMGPVSSPIVTEQGVITEKPPEKVEENKQEEKTTSIIGDIIRSKPNTFQEKGTTSTKQEATSGRPSVGIGDEQIDIESFIEQELSTVDIPHLSKEAQEKLGKITSRKIVEEYEKQLKEIRYELRQIVYEYNVLVDDNEDVLLSKDAEIILDRLSDIIDRIETLKKKIRVDDLDKYDDNYVYHLIEGYLQEFHDKKIVEEIEDSPLYIMISEKLDELEKKRGDFSKKVEDKKDRLVDKEADFERLKNNYYSMEQLNNQLLEFQYDQNRLLKEIQEKVANATTETERVREQFMGLDMQSRRLLALMSFQLMLPGPRFAKGLAASAAAYMIFMNNVFRQNTRTQRYRVIVVQDYHDQIHDAISSIEDSIRLLGKTSNQLDKMIREVEMNYHDYFGVVPECDSLLQNLKKIKSEIDEKEYEMERIKKQQELELEKNDEKVKTMGEYPVN